LTKGIVTTILKELDETGYGEHVIVIHPDLQALRKIYCQYTKNQLVDNNEIVLLLPHYETQDAVTNNLQESKSNDSSSSSTTSDVGCINLPFKLYSSIRFRSMLAFLKCHYFRVLSI
jgi:hypothetical protein